MSLPAASVIVSLLSWAIRSFFPQFAAVSSSLDILALAIGVYDACQPRQPVILLVVVEEQIRPKVPRSLAGRFHAGTGTCPCGRRS